MILLSSEFEKPKMPFILENYENPIYPYFEYTLVIESLNAILITILEFLFV